MQDYKKTFIWQKSFKLNGDIYEITKDFPQSEIFGLTSQIKRASISICSNIAEGCGRTSNKELANFLHIAFGSLKEVECQILISKREKYITSKEYLDIQEKINELSAMIVSFIKKVKDSHTR
jgi:four helix bundle protein